MTGLQQNRATGERSRHPRPNFLLIMTDQQRADHVGAYGNTQIRTPNIDSLASSGVVFDRFYTSSPICMPNRACVMTGRAPGAAGVRMNGVPLPLDARTFVDALRESGYRTGLVGKAHFQNMTEAPPTPVKNAAEMPRNHQGVFDLRVGPAYANESPASWQNPDFQVKKPYYGFEDTILCLEHGDQVGGDFARWLHEQGKNVSAPENDDSIKSPQAWRTNLDEAHYPTSFICNETIRWLRSYAEKEEARPFFLQCSFPDPHHPFTPPEPYWSRYSPEDVALPASFSASLKGAPPHKRAIHEELSAGLRKTSGSRVIAVNEAEARQAIALNYGSINMIDDALGRIVSAMHDLGLMENTVIIFMSDHGDFMGEHGLLFKGPLHYQALVRMPFIWNDPSAYHSKGRRKSLSCAMDIAPTILERAGVPLFHGIQGRSLLPVIDHDVVVNDAVLIEEESHRSVPGLPLPPRVRTLVTDRWRLSVYQDTDWGELYDLQEDPHEIHNLFDCPEASLIRAELLWKLSNEMIRHAPNLPLAMKMA